MSDAVDASAREGSTPEGASRAGAKCAHLAYTSPQNRSKQMPPTMHLFADTAGTPDHAKHDTNSDEYLPLVSSAAVFDLKNRVRQPSGSRPPRTPDHLFFIRDDEGGGP